MRIVLLDFRIGAGAAGDSAELVAVDPLEHHPFAVDQHPVVLHLKFAEAHLLGPVFHRLACGIVENDLQVIEHRLLGAPQLWLLHPAVQAGAFFQLHRFGEHCLRPVLQGQDGGACAGSSELDIQVCMGEVVPLKQGADRQVFQMNLRDGVEPDAAEDAREPVKVLVLAPAGSGPLEHLGCQLVDAGLDIGGQVKGVGREAVLGVAHIAAVEPEGHAALHALKLHPQGLVLHGLGQFKVLDVACHRIEPLGDLPRADVLPAIPGILGVGILRQVIALHLDVGRHADFIPQRAVVVLFFKAGDGAGIVFRVGEFPQPVQLHGKRALPCQHLGPGGIALAAGMGRQDIFLEKSGVFYLCIVKSSHDWHLIFKKTLLPPEGLRAPGQDPIIYDAG